MLKKECPECRGSGIDAKQEVLSGNKVLCPICNGTGKVEEIK